MLARTLQTLEKFQECFQELCKRWKNCVIAQWNCYEGNVV
jgi:hypothetical protein